MNILAEFKALKEKVAGFLADQTKATLANITDLSYKLSLLESGALAQLESAQASVQDLTAMLTQETANLSAATDQITSIKTALTAAASALKLDLKADATPVETITALQGAVTTTLARLNISAHDIPAPKPQDNNRPAGGKTLSLAEFNALTPQHRMAFSKEVIAGQAKLVE
jgi:hypothetical protein